MRITFTGDILIEKEQLYIIGEGDYSCVFSAIGKAFFKSDVVVGNLETPIAGKELVYTNHMWSFNTPENLLQSLKDTGFTVLTTANNHCLDRGVLGLQQTIINLDKYGFEHTGTRLSEKEKNYCSIPTPNGEIVIMSYTYGTNASFNNNYLSPEQHYLVNLFQPQEPPYRSFHKYNLPVRLCHKVKQIIKRQKYLNALKRELQLVKAHHPKMIIMCLHIGGQYCPYPSNYTKRISRWLLNNGVDLIVGNHEHVIHSTKWIGNKFVAYCLGNLTASINSEATSIQKNAELNKTEYSIILHIDIVEGDKRPQINFQITKIIIDDKGITRTVLLYDLIKSETNPEKKKRMIEDNNWVVRKVTNNQFSNVTLQKEYSLN